MAGSSRINNADLGPTFDAPQINTDIFSSINEIENSLAGTARDAIAWLKSNVKTLVKQSHTIVEDTKNKLPDDMNKSFMSNRLDSRSIGRMFMYIYDPKYKKTLPYYDTLPLLILIDFTNNGFRGLNLHYVPPFVRKRILEALVRNMNKSGPNEKKRIRLSYELLKHTTNFDIIKPCYKRYISKNVRSSFMYIDPAEWGKAVMLPTEQFKKKTKTEIYRGFVKKNLQDKIKLQQSAVNRRR